MVPPVLRNLWTLVWFLYAGQVCCFNFDTRLPIIKRGAHGTYFGFSVAEHIITRDDPTPKIDNSVLLVGAPLDQNAQPQTNKSGALWRCPLSTLSFDCEQVITDGKRDAAGDYEWKIDNDHLRPPQKDEIKDGQWLGVTVRTQGQGGKVLVCAHRYIRTATDCTLDTCRWGRGLCYTLDNDLQLNDVVEPCKGRPTERGHEQYGYCQAGTSGLLLEDNAIIGAPGPYTWRGTVFVQSVSDEFLDRDQTMYYTPHIDDQSPVDKYSYLGMAVTAANFFGNGIAYAAGAPRADGTGQVILFNRKTSVITMTTRMVLSGDMYTSNFGYELATADVNGDRLPDLIVGAPNYFDKNQGGAIYVYLNSKNSCSLKCSQPLKITGQPESRFGISITNLGDINKDGFEDIAVGAPYEGHGAIYIYLGSKNGTIPEPSQIIRGEDYNIETFGYSLSGGTDLDFNGYPDLLVGAFDSSAAILFRTRPIIWITTNVGPQSALQKIDPASRSCANKDLACFKFQACVSIQSILEGGKLKAGSEGLTLNCTLHADITRPRLPRVFIENGSPQSKPSTVHSTITLEIDPDTLELRPYCHNHTVYIKDDTKDIQTAISMRLSYSIIQEPPKPLKPGSELPKMDHYPILNQQQADKVFQATFLKDCGENDICESQLNIDANLDLPFTRTKDNKDSSRYDLILGEYKEIQLNVTVHNLQESAYEAELHITHSPALSYIAAVKGRCERFPEKNLVICPLGNPLQRNKGVNVSLRFEPLREVDEVPDVNFTLTATTTSHLVDRQNDVVLVANVIRKADLKLRGSVRPEEVLYGGQVRGESEMKYKDQPGTRLRHTYEVVNDGPWHVNNLELHVEWPFQVANNKPLGKWLLYMDDEPAIEAEEGGVCDTSEGQVNPLHLWDRHSLTNPELTPNSTGPAQVASTSRRSRRDVEMIVKKGPDNIVHMNCRAKTAKCFKFRCIVYKLQKGQSATVTIKARLWNSTLVEDYPRVKAVHIASNAKLYIPTPSVTITSQPFDTQATAVTIAKGGGFAEQQASDGVELWMILVGVVAGLLLLLLIALLFWKCGFFKRTRPDPTLSGNLEKHTDDYHDY